LNGKETAHFCHVNNEKNCHWSPLNDDKLQNVLSVFNQTCELHAIAVQVSLTIHFIDYYTVEIIDVIMHKMALCYKPEGKVAGSSPDGAIGFFFN
jgi:hypothetical protein